MIDKKDVIRFFDDCASSWDANMVRDEAIITTILDNAGVKAGVDVLDVACGTGVLFPDYLVREVASVTGIDISPKMAAIAAAKFSPEQVTVICDDVEETSFERQFDVVMVYNAFPHFPDAKKLIASLADVVKVGGSLSIAHGMSREKLDRHHSGAAHPVSNGLMSEAELASLMAPYFRVTVQIANDDMYQVVGIRNTGENDEK